MATPSIWTTRLLKRLAELWVEGRTTREIARTLSEESGAPINKDMVIGAARRSRDACPERPSPINFERQLRPRRLGGADARR